MKQGLRCGDLSFLLGPGGAASECRRMVGKCRTQSAWTKALTVWGGNGAPGALRLGAALVFIWGANWL